MEEDRLRKIYRPTSNPKPPLTPKHQLQALLPNAAGQMTVLVEKEKEHTELKRFVQDLMGPPTMITMARNGRTPIGVSTTHTACDNSHTQRGLDHTTLVCRTCHDMNGINHMV